MSNSLRTSFGDDRRLGAYLRDRRGKLDPATFGFPPGRLKKIELTPGAQFFNGMTVSKIAIEITNAREDGLALYRIYLAK